jgi:hypothetical protein
MNPAEQGSAISQQLCQNLIIPIHLDILARRNTSMLHSHRNGEPKEQTTTVVYLIFPSGQ